MTDIEYARIVTGYNMGDVSEEETLALLQTQANVEVVKLHQTKSYLDILLTGSLAQRHVVAELLLSKVPPSDILYPGVYAVMALKLNQPDLLLPLLSHNILRYSPLLPDARYYLVVYKQILHQADNYHNFRVGLLKYAQIYTSNHPVLFQQLGCEVIMNKPFDRLLLALVTDEPASAPNIDINDLVTNPFNQLNWLPLMHEYTDRYYHQNSSDDKTIFTAYVKSLKQKQVVTDGVWFRSDLELILPVIISWGGDVITQLKLVLDDIRQHTTITDLVLTPDITVENVKLLQANLAELGLEGIHFSPDYLYEKQYLEKFDSIMYPKYDVSKKILGLNPKVGKSLTGWWHQADQSNVMAYLLSCFSDKTEPVLEVINSLGGAEPDERNFDNMIYDLAYAGRSTYPRNLKAYLVSTGFTTDDIDRLLNQANLIDWE